MKPYRLPPARATLPAERESLDSGSFEQFCIYLLMAIAVAALALAEIKIS